MKTQDGWDLKPTTGVATADSGGWSKVAQRYPNLEIHVQFPSAQIETGSFFLTALIIQHLGRGNTTFVRRLSNNLRMQQIMTELANKLIPRPTLASCIKVFPWEELFDEATFRATCLTTELLAKVLCELLDFDIEDLVAIARDWHTNGY